MSSANRRLVIFQPPKPTFPSCSSRASGMIRSRKMLKRMSDRRHPGGGFIPMKFSAGRAWEDREAGGSRGVMKRKRINADARAPDKRGYLG